MTIKRVALIGRAGGAVGFCRNGHAMSLSPLIEIPIDPACLELKLFTSRTLHSYSNYPTIQPTKFFVKLKGKVRALLQCYVSIALIINQHNKHSSCPSPPASPGCRAATACCSVINWTRTMKVAQQHRRVGSWKKSAPGVQTDVWALPQTDAWCNAWQNTRWPVNFPLLRHEFARVFFSQSLQH